MSKFFDVVKKAGTPDNARTLSGITADYTYKQEALRQDVREEYGNTPKAIAARLFASTLATGLYVNQKAIERVVHSIRP